MKHALELPMCTSVCEACYALSFLKGGNYQAAMALSSQSETHLLCAHEIHTE